MSLIGMALHWHLPRHRMLVEERVKDGKLTEREARRQMQFFAVCAPTTAAIGLIALLLAVFDLAK